MPGAKGKSVPRKRKLSDEAFLALGRKHFAEDFPNPTRQGCPQDSVLKQAAEHPAQMSEEVFDHITLCSPCYNIFSDFLEKTRVQTARSERRTRSSKTSRR